MENALIDEETLQEEQRNEPDCYITGLQGDVEENDQIANLITDLFTIYHLPEPPPVVKFIVSTSGGALTEAFALYDVLRLLREKVVVETWAVGKVMSAGLMLVSAGTKGKRKATQNARFMFHSASIDFGGSINEVQMMLEELEHSQERYLQVLSDETKMSHKALAKMLSTNIDYYFDAYEAKKKGFIDEIV